MRTTGWVCRLITSSTVLVFAAGLAAGKVPGDYGKIPMVFEPNSGQSPKTTRFSAKGAGYTVMLESSLAVLVLRGAEAKQAQALRLSFTGGKGNIVPEAEQQQEGRSNYLIGADPRQWVTDVPHYGKVRYRDVYRGVDVVFYGNQRNLEYDFVVAPGADPKQIRLHLDGTRSIRLDSSGDLLLDLAGRTLRQHKPIVYQGDGADKQLVSARYILAGRDIRFEIGAYDRTKPLVIDPVLAYWNYVGGNSGDYAEAIAIDSFGNAYITGQTQSTSGFPLVSPAQGAHGGGGVQTVWDAFVTKINAAGTAIVYSTYLGGTGDDTGRGIAVDSAGNAYITGDTTSQTGFPGITGASMSPSRRGESDGFVTKLNGNGNGIVYSTYIGGDGIELGYAIAVDGGGAAHVVGVSNSAANFAGMNAGTFNGGDDGFLMRLTPAGNAATYGVFVGGAGVDVIYGVALDGGGNAYVAGYTSSAGIAGAIGTHAGLNDAFVAKYDTSGTRAYWRYLGGGGDDQAWAIAADAAGNTYIAGRTNSPNLTVMNAYQAAFGGGTQDSFAAKLNASGGLIYSTYLGGSHIDIAYGIAINGGTAYITGYTFSGNFPLASQIKAPVAARSNAFVTQLSAAGNSLVYSTALGGNTSESAFDIAVDGSGSAYVVGLTLSAGVNTGGVATIPGNVLKGTHDGFIAKLATAIVPPGEGSRFFPVTPCRVVDTRENRPAPFGGPILAAGVSRDFPVPNSGCGIPSNAVAYAVNATVVPEGTLGFLTLWPSGQPMPLVSTLNAPDGVTVANNAIVPVGVNSSISAIASHNTHLIIDINGYFAPSTTQGFDFVPTTPCRVADSREARPSPFGLPFLASGAQRNYPILMSECPTPTNAAAYALNATVVPRGFLGFVTLWPTGQAMPLASTQNGQDGNVIANGALVRAGINQSVSAIASNDTDLILDLNGYFPTTPGTGLEFHAVQPCRIVDTREARPGPYGAPFLTASTQRTFPVTAAGCAIPAAGAYSLNVTVVPRGSLGFITVWPTGSPRPLASTLNASDGNIVANGTIVRAGTNSSISLFVSHDTDVIIDVNGYFAQ